jgi:hypothetical protein
MAGAGLHMLIAKVLKNNHLVVLAGLTGEVRMAGDWLKSRMAPTPVYMYPVDMWSPADVDNRPYRWRRWSLMLVSIPAVTFAVCTLSVWVLGGGVQGASSAGARGMVAGLLWAGWAGLVMPGARAPLRG